MNRFNGGRMYRFLLVLLVAAAGCSRNNADPEEVSKIFARHSYAEADPAAVSRAAASGKAALLRAIDPDAVIIPPGRRTEQDYPGVLKASSGLSLWKTAAGLETVAVFPGSPAAAAGIAPGDVLKKLDGRPWQDLTAPELDGILAGRRGIEFTAEGEKKGGAPLTLTVKREISGFPLVWGFMVPGEKTGYLRLASFSAKTPEAVKKELETLAAAGARAVIIDLRHNYGGSLDALSETLALFAAGPKPLFKAVSRHPGYSSDFAAQRAGPFAGLKLALLTDNGTLSRAEVFAASLKEAGRAFTAGGFTAGNVAVTKTFRLNKGGKLRLTVAKLVTPAGTDLSDKGLAPDVPVEDPLDVEYAFAADFPPALASADPVIQAALKKLK
jgi:carboxyl-terminal processing protease